MKHCPRCNQDKDEEEFGKNRTRPDGLQVQCRACIKLIHHDWYTRNKERHYGNVQKRRKLFSDELARQILAYLKAHPCVDCGNANPLVLEFDALDGRNALHITPETTWDTLLPEMTQCEVRCANCRRLKIGKQVGMRRALMLNLQMNESERTQEIELKDMPLE